MSLLPWETRIPDIVADVRLYATSQGGKAQAARSGYGCPCFPKPDLGGTGWDARMQLKGELFEPGTERRVGFVFLTEEGAETIKRAGHFFLWEGRFIGEATVVG
jgi:hypothetical protein